MSNTMDVITKLLSLSPDNPYIRVARSSRTAATLYTLLFLIPGDGIILMIAQLVIMSINIYNTNVVLLRDCNITWQAPTFSINGVTCTQPYTTFLPQCVIMDQFEDLIVALDNDFWINLHSIENIKTAGILIDSPTGHVSDSTHQWNTPEGNILTLKEYWTTLALIDAMPFNKVMHINYATKRSCLVEPIADYFRAIDTRLAHKYIDAIGESNIPYDIKMELYTIGDSSLFKMVQRDE